MRPPGRDRAGQGSLRRAIPRAWPPAPWRYLGLCDRAPRRPPIPPCRSSFALVPIQLRREPPLADPFDDLQRITQQSTPPQLALRSRRPSPAGRYKGYPGPRPGGAVSARTAAYQRHSLCDIAALPCPSRDRSSRTRGTAGSPARRHRDQLAGARPRLRDRRQGPAIWRPSPGSPPQMADEPACEPQRLLRCSGQCLVGKAETEKGDP